MEQPIVFVNVGWMENYKGPKNDPTLGGHGWLKKHDYGHEAWNFLPEKGRCYGYVPGAGRVNIRNLGATSRDESVQGVTVVWVARSPQDKVTYLVGWYRDARIHIDKEHTELVRDDSITVGYQIDAPVACARLLTLDQRTLAVPTAKAKGNMGQRPIWYGNDSFVKQVRAYINADGELTRSSRSMARGARQPDPELRKKIELAAIRHATRYYKSSKGGRRSVDSVEKDNVGWDLNILGGDVELRVEVKGLSGDAMCVELTPNEYTAMMRPQYRSSYVVYVVTNALHASAASHVFRYNAEVSKGRSHIWMASDGRRLVIQELTGARLTAK